MKATRYSLVIATRNRPEALALSLPLMIQQSRSPELVVIVDSSGDPARNQRTVAQLQAQSEIPLSYQISAPGSSLQRNIGLAQVKTEVVVFPDDDSLFLPDALQAMMRIYDLDKEKHIGGVCAREATSFPGIAEIRASGTCDMTKRDRVKALIGKRRNQIEARFLKDPFVSFADARYADMPPAPDWLGTENAVLVPYMTGFRMSFRTETIRARGFDEALGRYALAEDVDASFGILRHGQYIVGARNAGVFHYKAPARRADGRAMGAMFILNRAYVLARNGATDPALIAQTKRYCLYKLTQYAAGTSSGYGRERFLGAFSAYRRIEQIMSAPKDELGDLYLSLRKTCFGGAD